MEIGFKRLTDDAILPTKAHKTDSGFDLYANEDVIIEPNETKLIKTGIAVHLPEGFEAQVRPRSGVTSKTKLRVQLGTIDNEYTGGIGIIVENNTSVCCQDTPENFTLLNIKGGIHTDEDGSPMLHDYKVLNMSYLIKKGDKLAQLVVQEIPQTTAYEIHEIKDTERGSNGFGSSGY